MGSTADPDLVRSIGLLGVPTTAGSHHPGQEKAPDALRAAGLVESLRATGRQVRDFGNVPVQRHRPSARVDGVRDLARVVEVVAQTADQVATIQAEGFVPLVLGGDCTITLGVVAGLTRARNADEVGLVYVDGDADLNTPATSDSGVLDTMGVTHLLGDGLEPLAGVGAHHPLLGPESIELFGFDPGELDTQQWTKLVSLGLHATPAPAVREDPRGRAVAALSRLEAKVDTVLVHLDVDVLDSGLVPLGNFPHFAGLTVPEVAQCLSVFCSSDAFAGLVLTEVNPDHDPDGLLLPILTRTLSEALAGRPATTAAQAPR